MMTKDDPRLTAYVLGELDASETETVQKAIQADPQLAQALQSIRETIQKVQSSFEQMPALTLPEQNAEARSPVAALETHRDKRSSGRLWKPLALAASALAMVSVAGALWWKPPGETPLVETADMQIQADQEGVAMEQATAEGEAYLEEATDAAVETKPAADSLAMPEPADTWRSISRPRTLSNSLSQDKEKPEIAQFFAGGAVGPGSASSGLSAGSPASAPTRRVQLNSLQQPAGEALSFEVRERGVTREAGMPAPAIIAGRGLQPPAPEPTAEIPRFSLQDSLPELGNVEGDRFDVITDNPFQRVAEQPLSTFSIDVDTASYSKVRQALMGAHRLPRPDSVRIEEMVNYFHYDYEGPTDQHPFAASMEVASCPWNPSHRLARIAIQGRKMEIGQRPPCNLVFLLDTSGSMNADNKLPLVKSGMKMLLEQLNGKDRVAIVTYAGSAGVALPSTAVDGNLAQIDSALDQLVSSGSTNGAQGIQLAYQIARENKIEGGVNRVILCTDGDFNVGVTGTDSLVQMVKQQADSHIFLSVLGFGMGNLNDAMLEQISGKGNGNYAFVDTQREARKVLVEQTNATLVTIAKDVKIQVEFNPGQVAGYRLLGYENRMLAKEDFNDDKIDAGEIGAGHQVTAFYELIPPGIEDPALRPQVDELKYGQKDAAPDKPAEAVGNNSPELLTVKLRYKQPEGTISTKVDFAVIDQGTSFAEASTDFRFAAAVAAFGMQLRRSPYRGDWNYQSILETASGATGKDVHELRQEFLEMIKAAEQWTGEE